MTLTSSVMTLIDLQCDLGLMGHTSQRPLMLHFAGRNYLLGGRSCKD
jgi:hypothetical protein